MKKGFTLLEVLSAMAVLALLVLVLARMFMVVADVTKKGTTTMDRNSAAEIGMETMLNSIEGMVVNEFLSCYVFGPGVDESGFGHDRMGFLTTATIAPNDSLPYKPYEFQEFYVTNRPQTNAAGVAYMAYELRYRYMKWSTARTKRLVGMEKDWWEASAWKNDASDEVLIPNVVRFDCYVVDYNGDNAMNGSVSLNGMLFDSRNGYRYDKTGHGITNAPPAAFDLYIQVASADAAVEAGMLLMSNDPELEKRGREILVRDSAVYFARAVPVCGPGRFLEAHDQKPHHYYFED